MRWQSNVVLIQEDIKIAIENQMILLNFNKIVWILIIKNVL